MITYHMILLSLLREGFSSAAMLPSLGGAPSHCRTGKRMIEFTDQTNKDRQEMANICVYIYIYI